MSIFEKFRKNNRKYCKIFGIKVRYGKVPYSKRALAKINEVKNNIANLENSVVQLQNIVVSNNAAKIAAIQDFIAAHTKQITDTISEYNSGAISKVPTDVTAIKAQMDYTQRIFPIYLAAQAEHKNVFPKYKNCHKGKNMVLLASGPTLDDYTPQQDCLFMGVNKSFMAGKADLDYLFVQDLIPDAQDKIDAYRGNNCKKFYGVHYCVPGISWSNSDKANAERYYFIDCNSLAPWPFPVDCSTMPFNTYSSVVFPAAVFALWSGVKKLYIVGCDTNLNGYFGEVNKNALSVDNVVYGWQRFKEFAQTWYPDTEIISINPVGLKGLFKDVYTESYLKKHPEIAKTNPEILK